MPNHANSRWLVLGAAGMLGADLTTRLRATGAVVTGLTRRELDLADPSAIRAALAGHPADIVVNCAAWTAVDDAETREKEAHAVNGEAVRVLAEECAERGVRLIHVSTDYVFDGAGSAPIPEDAPPRPVSAYGRTKLAGEREVLAIPGGYVVRTAWLYGAHGSNFVRTMLRLEQEREHLQVVDDQCGQPTWTADLAAALADLGVSGAPAGIYHATNSGDTTWHGFAQAIFKGIGADPARVRATTSENFPRPAQRPAYSVLASQRWSRAGLSPLRPWQEALAAALPELTE